MSGNWRSVASNPWSLVRRYDYPESAFIATLLVYGATAWLVGHTSTPTLAYFDRLSAALIEGQFDLPNPPHTADLTLFDGRWYVPFPPLPALLMIPLRLLALPINTVWFSIFVGSLTALFVDLLLRSLESRDVDPVARPAPGDAMAAQTRRWWLLAFFALGLPWYIAIDGNVWFLSHTCTLLFVAIAAWLAATDRSGLAVGAALGMAMLGRPHLLLNWFLLAGLAWSRRRRGAMMRWTLLSAIGPLAATALLLVYNYVRFHDPLEFGYRDQQVDPRLMSDLYNHGLFHWRYLERGVHAALLAFPALSERGWFPVPRETGLSLVITSPALLMIGLTVRRRDPRSTGAWLSVVTLFLLVLAYYNPGWAQFGYRFSLDFLVPLTVLLAIVARTPLQTGLRWLTLAGVLVNAWGVWWWFIGRNG